MFRKIFWCFLFCFAVWLGGLIWFAGRVPVSPPQYLPDSDAIVVLTGGSGRLIYGLQLLAEGKGKKLFVSGVSRNMTVPVLLRQAASDAKAPLPAIDPQAIALGHQARNTIGNADETAHWLKAQGYHSILLVTSDYHMPRSLLEFQKAEPGIRITPAPVFPSDFITGNWWMDGESRTLMLLEYHKFLAASARHWLIAVMHRS